MIRSRIGELLANPEIPAHIFSGRSGEAKNRKVSFAVWMVKIWINLHETPNLNLMEHACRPKQAGMNSVGIAG
jgi:hypothetical protein